MAIDTSQEFQFCCWLRLTVVYGFFALPGHAALVHVASGGVESSLHSHFRWQASRPAHGAERWWFCRRWKISWSTNGRGAKCIRVIILSHRELPSNFGVLFCSKLLSHRKIPKHRRNTSTNSVLDMSHNSVEMKFGISTGQWRLIYFKCLVWVVQ